MLHAVFRGVALAPDHPPIMPPGVFRVDPVVKPPVKLLDVRLCDLLISCQPGKQVIGFRMAGGFKRITDGLSPEVTDLISLPPEKERPGA